MIKRIDEIDVLKGFGILLMIMGHIGFGYYFDYWIHAFHMPMFYIISGFLYKKKEMSSYEFIRKKTKSLLVPYIFFGLLHYLLYVFINIGKYTSLDLFNPLNHLLFINTDGLPIAGALWFLTSLFFVDIIYYLVDRQNKINKNLLVLMIMIIGLSIPGFIRLPWALDTSFVGIGLYHISYLLRKYYHQAMKQLNILSSLILIGGGSILTFLNGYINVRQGIYSNIIIFIVVSVLMTSGLYILISNSMSVIPDKLKQEFTYIGRNSIVYLCLNQLVILVVTKILSVILLPDNIKVLLIMKVIVFIISMIVLRMVSCILNADKLKVLIGK